MSTDVITFQTRYFQARRDLEAAQIAQQQAVDAQHHAEELARRAEERADHERNEADGWRMFAHNPDAARVITQYSQTMPDCKREAFIDHLYDLWAHGERIDNIDAASLANDYTEASR